MEFEFLGGKALATNPKCAIIKPNNMACEKNAIAYIKNTSEDFMPEVRDIYVCQYHWNLISAAAQKYGEELVENDNAPTVN